MNREKREQLYKLLVGRLSEPAAREAAQELYKEIIATITKERAVSGVAVRECFLKVLNDETQ